jgi:flagellar export protein FliJ
MRPFVFRARAALDFRRKKDEDAQRDLAAAESRVATARTALDQSMAGHRQALDDAKAAESVATDLATLVWYRNWIVVLQRDIERCEGELNGRMADAQAARERATRTHIDVRVLEKLEQRARKTYDAAVAREEQQAIDWLAVLQAASQAREREGRA